MSFSRLKVMYNLLFGTIFCLKIHFYEKWSKKIIFEKFNLESNVSCKLFNYFFLYKMHN